MMTHEKKLSFVHKMTQLGLSSIPHLADGGQPVNTSVQPQAAAPLSGNAAGAVNTNAATQSVGTGMLGLNNNFQANSAALTQGTNVGQLQSAYSGAQQGLTNQSSLTSATQPGANQALQSQSDLMGQLTNEANGQGPNPAQAALNQNTAANVSNQAALMAGQRGASANVGAMAKNNAEVGAATQQNAVGQEATLQAQQQLAAQQQLQTQQQTMYNQGASAIQNQASGAQGEQSILQGANSALNSNDVGMQSNVNSVNAQAAAQNSGLVPQLLGAGAGAVASIAAMFAKGGVVGAPKCMAAGGVMTPGGPQSSIGQYLSGPTNATNFAPAGASGYAAQAPTTQAAPASASSPSLSQAMAGGQAVGQNIGQAIQNYQNTPSSVPITSVDSSYTQPELGSSAANANAGSSGMLGADIGGSSGPMIGGSDPLGLGLAKGGKVKKPLPMMGGQSARLISKGGPVKAQNKSEKAVSNKDSYANDKVPAMLSAGEVVMDKDTLNDPGPIGQMARAVAQHIQARNAVGKKGAKRV